MPVMPLVANTKGAPSGRWRTVEVRGPRGRKTIRASTLRRAIGNHKLPSTFITEATRTGGSVRFRGHGFGHGVGLCQYGAQGMAESGLDFREILARYYSGAAIVRVR